MGKLRIFTDGACSGNPGPGGFGALLLLKDEIIHEISGFEKETTNNRMELKAVIEGLKLALQLGYYKVDIYSDSAYVVNSIKQKWVKKWYINGWRTTDGKEVKNKDLWVELLNLIKQIKNKGGKFNIIKIKGHSGDYYNERVDKLAKTAMKRL